MQILSHCCSICYRCHWNLESERIKKIGLDVSEETSKITTNIKKTLTVVRSIGVGVMVATSSCGVRPSWGVVVVALTVGS